MLFGKRDKKRPNERVEDLKARVDALRQADQANRAKPYSLDHFLEGDDVLTGREVEDHYEPSGFSPERAPSFPEPGTNAYEAALAAELEKYLRREEKRAVSNEPPAKPEPSGVEPNVPETTSLLLDGTWSRDGDRRNRVSAADRAWNVVDRTGLPQADDAPPSSESPAPPEAPLADWRDGMQWSTEEELPPREEAG